MEDAEDERGESRQAHGRGRMLFIDADACPVTR